MADPGPPADRSGEYLDVGDRTTSCHFCDAPLWDLEMQDAEDERRVWSVEDRGWVVQQQKVPTGGLLCCHNGKAQGLTLRRVGVHVEEDVFSHGQLYVAFSRCGDPDNLCVFGPKPDKDNAVWIKNVVYREVLIDDM